MGKILNSLGGAALNLGVSAFNNKLAEMSAEKQYQRQLDFWEKQNAYNSPSNQRALFERAGFNPAAAMGDIAQGSTAQGLSDVPGNEFAQRGAVDARSLQESFTLVAELEKLGAETSAIRSQVQLNAIKYLIDNEQLLGFKLDNQQKEYLLSRLSEMTDANVSKIIAEARNLNSSSDLNEEKKETEGTIQAVNTATASNLDADTNLKNAQASYAASQAALVTIQSANYTKEVNARIRSLDAAAAASFQQAAYYRENTQLLANQNDLAEYEKIYEDNIRYTSDALGFEIADLPPVTQVELQRAVNDRYQGKITEEEFQARVSDIIYTANTAATAVLGTRAQKSSTSYETKSSSTTVNYNKPQKY